MHEKRKKVEHESFVELKRDRLEFGEAEADGIYKIDYLKEESLQKNT